MNDNLKKFLRYLDDLDADEIWKWLDSNPDAVTIMIEMIVESHPELQEKAVPKSTMEKEPFNPDNPFKGDD
jgi:hypothetical protein